MVKLSQQLSGQRVTRTQRVLQQEQQRKLRGDSRLLQQAQAIQQTQFSGVTSLAEYRRRYESLPDNIKPFFTPPGQLQASVEEQKQQEISNIDRLIEKREEKIRQERSRANPRESRIARLEAELEALEKGREFVVRRGASSGDVLKFARKTAETRVESQRVRQQFPVVIKGRVTESGGEFVTPLGKRFVTNKEGQLVGVQDPVRQESRLANIQDILEFRALQERREQVARESLEQMSIADSLKERPTVSPVTGFGLVDRPRFEPTKLGGDQRFFSPVEKVFDVILPQLSDAPTTTTLQEIKELQESGDIIGLTKEVFGGQREAEKVNKVTPEINKAIEKLEEKKFTQRVEQLNRDTAQLEQEIKVFNLNPTDSAKREELFERLGDLERERRNLGVLLKDFRGDIRLINIKFKGEDIKVEEKDGELQVLSGGQKIDTRSLRIKSLQLIDTTPGKVAFGTGVFAKEFGTGAVEFALLGGAGVLTRVNKAFQTAGRTLRIPSRVGKGAGILGGTALAGGVVTLESIEGFEQGLAIDRPIEGAVIGGLGGLGRVGGAVTGGVLGSRQFRIAEQRRFENLLKKNVFVEESLRTGEPQVIKLTEEIPGGKIKTQFETGQGITRQVTKSTKRFPGGIQSEIETTLGELTSEGVSVGTGGARVKLRVGDQPIQTRGQLFTLRSIKTGDVRLKVFTPVTEKGVTQVKFQEFLISQSEPKVLSKVTRGDIVQKNFDKIFRQVRLLSEGTVKPGEVPGDVSRAFPEDLLTQVRKGGQPFTELEFFEAKPFSRSASLEKVNEDVLKRTFITQAEGLGLSRKTQSDLTKAINQALKQGIGTRGRASLSILPELEPTSTVVSPKAPSVKPLNVDKIGRDSLNIADRIAGVSVASTSQQSVLAQQGIGRGIFGFGLPGLTGKTVQGFTRQQQLNKIIQNQLAQQKQQQLVVEKTQQKINQQLKSQQIQKTAQLTEPALITEIITPTTPIDPPVPTRFVIPGFPPGFPPFFFPGFFGGGGGGRGRRQRFGTEIKAFLPDFTARALGLDPIAVTPRQAQALVNKELTGFEIKRGAFIVKKPRKKKKKGRGKKK